MTSETTSQDKPQTKYLRDYTPPPFIITDAHLEFDIFDDHTIVTSRLKVEKNSKNTQQTATLELNAENMEILSVLINEQKLPNSDWVHQNDQLTLNSVGESQTITITNKIIPHENKALSGLYQSNKIFCTQCEPEGFRRITPYIDRSDVMCRFTVKITANKQDYPILLSNGNPQESGDLDDGRHFSLWHDPHPKPSYLFALVAGDLGSVTDTFTTQSGKIIPLTIYVDKGNEDKCHWAMESLKRAMKWDEETFGLEYDLDMFNIVAVDDFNFGAMENKGLNIFNSSAILAKPETATDSDFEVIEGIVAHEYFHNWTGNRITCRDWFQLTLKEGLTVFRDQEFSADMNSRAVNRVANVTHLRNAQFSEDAGPTAHPIRPESYIEVNNFYTSTVYQKGSEIIRMIHTLIGKENFRKGMDRYFELFDGQAVTCEDFVRAMSDASGYDFSQFMNWYNQAGTPRVSFQSQYDAANKKLLLTVKQEKPVIDDAINHKPYCFPLSLGLIDAQGQEISFKHNNTDQEKTTHQLNITKEEETFEINDISSEPIISLNRDFSAPIHLTSQQSDQEKMTLFKHDRDHFNRFEAGQLLAMKALQHNISLLQEGQHSAFDDQLLDTYGEILNDSTIDPHFKSELISLPSAIRLIEAMGICDYDNVHQARKEMLIEIARRHKDLLVTIYQSMQDSGDYQINAASFGRRHLKNMCLAYLMKLDDEQAQDMCVNQFKQATNMTDEISSLSLICHSQSSQRKNLLKHFYDKWKQENLVMNKWLSVQAIADRPEVLNNIKELEKDPIYNHQNPNKVRSLIGSFVGNFVHYHNKNGDGYRFIADKIIACDQFNPQLASRLCVAFRKYAHLDTVRQQAMNQELNRIVNTQNISPDVYEMVSKTLASVKTKLAN